MSVISAACRRSSNLAFLLLWAVVQSVQAGGDPVPLRGRSFDRAQFPNPHAHIPAQCYIETSQGTQKPLPVLPDRWRLETRAGCGIGTTPTLIEENSVLDYIPLLE